MLRISRQCIGRSAFSLLELLAVIAVISMLLALAVPNIVPLAPSRRASAHELTSFLIRARAEAVAMGEERAVGFTGETSTSLAFRAYALFRLQGAEESDDGIEKPAEFRRSSTWRRLPEGTIFAKGRDHDLSPGEEIKTVHDFPWPDGFSVAAGDGGERETIPTHCLIFGADGGVKTPAFADADALLIGIAEGYCDSRTGERFFTGNRIGADGRQLAVVTWVEVLWHTGFIRVLNEG